MSSGSVLVGRYELGDCLGSGGMAQVFRAHDRLLDRGVAVKLFGPGIDPNGPARARSEMRTLAGLSHPNLVVVHDAGTDGEHVPPRAFLVMQLIDGPSLGDVLRDGPLPGTQVRDIGVGVAQALAYVHARGVVHRDVKPGNVLIERTGRPFLADFGIAQTLGASTLTATGLTVGTVGYLSPEQVRGQEVGPASDVFSFGLVLLEAFTGQREYTGTSAETALARLSRPPVLSGRVPAAWTQLLARMTAADPSDRPTAQELAAELEALVEPATSGAGTRATSRSATSPTAATATAPDQTRVLAQPAPALDGPDPAHREAATSRTTILPRVQTSGTPHRRRIRTRYVVLMALVLFAGVIVALQVSSGSSGSPTPAAPTGTPGPGRLDADLNRLQQLVRP